ncbi:MAG: hypothetical protein FWH16_00750 [Oscillospiraceae bacterium]|nr:hypothetical protein [Oscillospiraceae bacterium]
MFANNLTLCKLIFRRDRLRLPVWFAVIASLIIGFGAALPNMFDTPEGRETILIMMENPAMIAMMGPIYLSAGGAFSLGAMYSLFMLVWSAIGMAFMNIFLVVRHTRQDEELGRIEVVRSLPTGRLANLSATLTAAVIVNAAFALLLGLGLGLVGAEDMTFSGAMLFGAAMGAVGLVFAAVTAIFCQISANPRTASAFSFLFLGAVYMLRAAGDMRGNEALACLSPFGLISRTKTYIDNEWWPIFVLLGASVVFSAAAFRLCAARDMGEGLIAARPGRRDAKPYLKSPGGLAWRMLKTSFIVWVILMPVLSMSYGSIMGDIDQFIQSADFLIQFTGGDPLRMIGFLIVLMSICSTIPVLMFMTKARAQESRGYAEHVLARAASRHSQLRGYFLFALLASVLMPFLNCFGFWAASLAVMDTPFAFSEIFNACMVYSPAMMFMLGMTVLLIGYFPKRTNLAYIYLGYAFFSLYLGGLMDLPEWLAKLSPFGHVPVLPLPVGAEIETGQIVALILMPVLGAAMTVLGFIGHKNRDMVFSQ